jgi:hypothetical protein
MGLSDILRMGDGKRSQKRDALEKLQKKLRKHNKKLEDELKAESAPKKIKKLKDKLETNKRHRRKVKRLLAELE